MVGELLCLFPYIMLQRVHPARLAEFEKHKAKETSSNKAKQSESVKRLADEMATGSTVKKVRQTTLIPTSNRGLSLFSRQSHCELHHRGNATISHSRETCIQKHVGGNKSNCPSYISQNIELSSYRKV
jgi:hypothetical protein